MGKSRGGETMARHFDTWEDALTAVKDGLSLSDVPDELKIPDVCLAAVQQDGRALEYVSDTLKDACSRRRTESFLTAGRTG
jgi:hypothetical protein